MSDKTTYHVMELKSVEELHNTMKGLGFPGGLGQSPPMPPPHTTIRSVASEREMAKRTLKFPQRCFWLRRLERSGKPQWKLTLFNPAPGTHWHVTYECRDAVVRVSEDGAGFFAPGQDPFWPLDAAREWIKEIRL